MKRNRNLIGFVCGFLAAIMLFSMTNMPALAASMNDFIEVFTGVRVYVNDAPLDPGDLHGNPDAFIYNGTTYVAVRGVSNSLGQDVLWDGESRSVYIGKHANSSTYLLDVCKPYEAKGYNTPATMTMGGTKYANGFRLNGGSDPGYAYFNLNGKYTTLDFDVGHIDGDRMENTTCNIYLDDRLTMSFDLQADMLPKHYTVPLNGALKMKLELTGAVWDPDYGFANVMVS